ncbi:HD domain-containing protein [Cohnella sp. CFH 77786]|uniref:HD-GYP domain-containing protein n=1 Tax=Cohnella sp. CFH 77786 TaxID=2662265 RepID=UPI001C6091FE|nr:HD-GYP domain-containing protein [Cohnella sp. CFH 77786]MBW5447574.1 HD domain-containing protein [Cohnella sp. CFH 77786]
MDIKITRSGEYIERFSTKGLVISHICSGDGTEVIHHKLEAGFRWYIAPEEGWLALEYAHILAGELVWKKQDEDVVLRPGDSISAYMITEMAMFVASKDTEFLYVVSRPYFHNYSGSIQKLFDLAVKIEEKDGYTSDHCDRIKRLSVLLGERLGLSPYEMYILSLAGFLHDIGKTQIPEHILNKPNKLTDEEYEQMKLHTTYGKQLLHDTGMPDLRIVGDVVEQHHERYDGKGYPHGLQGDQISKPAAIISIVDAYDAMTIDRVYQKGRPRDVALQEIERCSGSMYHPEIVKVFLSIGDQLA